MQKTKKVIRYSENNISKYYLSPYVNISYRKGKVFIKQWLFVWLFSLECDEHLMLEFIKEIENGLSFSSVIKELEKIFGANAEVVLSILLKNGIIE